MEPCIEAAVLSRTLLSRTLLLCALLAPAAAGQRFHMPSNTPTTGSCNLIPFGDVSTKTWGNQKYQQLHTWNYLGGSSMSGRICGIAFAACYTGIRHFDTSATRSGPPRAKPTDNVSPNRELSTGLSAQTDRNCSANVVASVPPTT